ncbi:pregnancy zone protein-like, partial [Asbolus verrucosus]
MPKTLLSGRNESFFPEHSCFELNVPKNIKEPQFASVRVQVQLNGIVHSAHNQDPDYKVSQVRIRNPFGIGVVSWENVSTELGLAHLEHQLSRDPIEGKWQIEADGEVKTFEVNKYVLPRFKIHIIHPKIIYYKIPSTTIKVCAKYSHGGVVKGTAFIRLTDSYHNMKTIQNLKKMTNGCAEFSYTNEDLFLSNIRKTFSMIEPKINIHITATVTEYGTDKIGLKTAKRLPYHGAIELNNINTDMEKEVIEICYNIAIKKSWNYLNNEQCSNFTLNARSLNHTNIGDSLLVVRLYSPSSTYIMLDQIQPWEKTKCRTIQQFTIHYTADRLKERENITIYYMIKSRSQIYKLRKIALSVYKHYPNYFDEYNDIIGTKHKHIKSGSAIGKFILKFKLDERIISNYYLLVYYISETGEVVSATKEVEVDPCLTNKVEANWSHKQIAPGGTASLLIQTKSESLCSVSATDKAVKFMDDFKKEKFLIPAENHVFLLLRKIETKFGTITITNFKVVTKPCYTGPIPPTNNPVQFLTDQYDVQNEDNITPIRSFFPETWLWELVPVRSAAVIHRNLPHTITNWETNVLCVSRSDGVGFSKITEISTYQPFFVDMLTPYSIKRGETLYLSVIVFNHLSYNIPIRITLGTSDGLKVVDSLNRRSFSYCVSSNNTVTHIFEIKGVEIGTMNVTAIAELDSAYPGQCGPDVLVHKRDVVFKTLVVEPEGYPYKETKSALICVSGTQTSNNVTWDFKIPESLVPKTSKTQIILNGDILGQTIENLEDLIIMPTGCGEQIMATMAPNIYILRYLNITKNLTPSIKHRILRNLKIGYQRILNYIHKDGSFSAFGYHDPAGSMFLTAFVVRTLQEVKQFIYVDQRIIDRAVEWIMNHQLENGCFNTMLHVFQDMGATSTENSTAALTSYVMISLLDGNIEVPEPVKTNAKYCIRGHYHLDKYTLAISSYALFKVNWYSEAHRMLKKLSQISHQKDNMMWWTNRDTNGSMASDIEITSYILLSLLHEKTQENLAKAHSIVRWLSTKQGPNGGFRSTQDTVVALDALSRYSYFVSSKQLNMDIALEASEQNYQFKIKSEDRLKSKKVDLKQTDTFVKINVQGEGCLLAQALNSYYLKQKPSNAAFKLDMEILPVSNIDECSITTLSSCFTYQGPDVQANMAVLEVDLPSGYQADRASLYKLIDEDTTTKVKMFEELQQKIILYFTKLDAQQICINFNINENAVVHSRSESTVKLYDYYKPEYAVLQFYKINDKCKFNNSTIPDISRNITANVSSENGKNIVKRNSGINPNFTDVDFELATP